MAVGDLDGDGADDLVIGIPQANYGGTEHTGAIDIVWGQRRRGFAFGGLTNTGVTQLHQPGTLSPESWDLFGAAVAIGDFNCDGHPDLAVGAPGDTPAANPAAYEAGNVSILYGPTFATWQIVWQGNGVADGSEYNDAFGATLAAGNFNGDAHAGIACDDLAIGAPGEDTNTGAVTVLYGRSTGLNSAGALTPQFLTQATYLVPDVPQQYDSFGFALETGDFNDDGLADLAISAPGESYENLAKGSVGVVHVLEGTSGGLLGAGSQFLELSGFPGLAAQQDAWMGWSLARGDFDGDGDDDLAIGAQGLNIGGAAHAGGVLIYLQVGGSLVPGLKVDQNEPALGDVAESYDSCGFSLTAGDFDGNGTWDLASGCSDEDIGSPGGSEGALNVAYFGVIGGELQVVNGQFWHQDSPGIPDSSGSFEHFSVSLIEAGAKALATGDFNGDGEADLAAGSPSDSWNGDNPGAVNIFYGAP